MDTGARITGVRFVLCVNHPQAVARSWRGEGDDRKPYCDACLRPERDAEAVARMRHDPKVSAALDAYVEALKSGNRKAIADAKRTVRLYLRLADFKTFERHLADLDSTP